MDAPMFKKKSMTIAYDPMSIMKLQDRKEKRRLFALYDELRQNELLKTKKAIKNVIISETMNQDFKDLAHTKI